MTCCKNVWLSLKTNSAFQKAFKLQGKNAHSTVLQNAWSQKNQHFHWKNEFNHQKPLFSLKNDPGWQKNLEHREKLITAIQNKRVLWKAMTCCKNVWLSLKTNSAFKKAFKLQEKKRPQHCLTKCLKPRKPTLSLKKRI